MSFAALQGSVPVLGQSAERVCFISDGNCIGVHTMGRATLCCVTAGHN